jgi:hypothetical protein
MGRIATDETAPWDVRTSVAIKLLKHVLQQPEDLKLLASRVPRMTTVRGWRRRFDPFDFLVVVSSRPLLRASVRSRAAIALRRHGRPQRPGFLRELWRKMRYAITHDTVRS